MFFALFLACNPLRGVADREAVWWGPPDEIESTQRIDLVELPSGEPVGYWPRIVVYADRIEVDNRAWFLSLPEGVPEGLEPELARSLLLEPIRVGSVEQGRMPAGQKRGQLLSPVYDALLQLAERNKDFAMATGDASLEFNGKILIVPDASISLELLRELVFTAGQAQYGHAGLAGASEGRVRMASAFDGTSCAMTLVLDVTTEGAYVQASSVSLRGETCPTPATDLPGLIEETTEACRGHHDAVAVAVAERHPGVAPIDSSEWRCAMVHHLVGGEGDDGTTVADLLPVVASVHAIHPAARQGFLMGDGGLTNPTPCAHRVRVEDLTGAQLDEVCNLARILEHLDGATQAVALGQPELRWHRKRGALLESLGGEGWFVDGVSGKTSDGAVDQAMQEVLRRYGPQLAYCLERDGVEALKEAGPVTFRGKIAVADQAVVSHEVSFVSDPAVEKCANSRPPGWRFPAEVSGSRTFQITARWGRKP